MVGGPGGLAARAPAAARYRGGRLARAGDDRTQGPGSDPASL